jgi:hypothetical protein
MNAALLDYPSNSQIAARLTYKPEESAPTGFILIRDINNRVWRTIGITGDQGDTWIDLTRDVVLLELGFVEVALIRTRGTGPWSATLHLRATSMGRIAEAADTTQRKHNHLDPSVLFRNTTSSDGRDSQ